MRRERNETGGRHAGREPQQREAAAGRSPIRSTHRLLFLGSFVLAFIVVVVGIVELAPRFRAAPAVTTPEHGEHLPTALRSLIEQHVSAAKASPRDARRRATLGLVYEANKLWPEARRAFENATRLQPDEPMWPHHAAIAWISTGDIAGAADWLRRFAKRYPGFAPIQHRLGMVELEGGDLRAAEQTFRRVIALAPRRAEGYAGLGDTFLRLGQAPEAIAPLEKAVALDPGYKSARYLLGRAYRLVGRLDDAERELSAGRGGTTRYLKDAVTAELAAFMVGIGSRVDQAIDELKAGRADQAAAMFEDIRAAEPDNVDALVNLGLAYLRLGRIDDAEGVLNTAKRLNPNRFEVYINLAACYRRTGRLSEALAAADRAVALSPSTAQAHLTRALILRAQNDDAAAVDALATAAKFDAQNTNIIQELANVCVRLERYPEALRHFQTLSTMLPGRPEPWLGIGKVYYLMGRYDEAGDAADRGLEIAPNEPRLRALARRLHEIAGE